ncbi:Cytochrome c oxidase subunit 6b-1 [Apostasia shenzhenica]|uniref:Cytochrome c oxidase subunit 6b-1 n=1 Tax=Apostasia shenzhenica TaxID=1088818 RepID=A0A2I0A5G5_9ASPA|nr:Cytochrome c oxidase subunit 6b-1 [Apostasia shenzhenica]
MNSDCARSLAPLGPSTTLRGTGHKEVKNQILPLTLAFSSDSSERTRRHLRLFPPSTTLPRAMVESDQQQNVPSLARQWLLEEHDELSDHKNAPEEADGEEKGVAEASEEVFVEKIEASVEGTSQAKENSESHGLEIQQTKAELQEVVENPPTANGDSENPKKEVEQIQVTDEKEDFNENTSSTAENSEEKQEAEEETTLIKLETAPADFRFPTTNQTRHCFTRYIEYHRCIAAKGEDAPECQKFAKYYRSLCPGEWIERWNEQRENGTFPGPL